MLVGWLIAIALLTYLIHSMIYASKEAQISYSGGNTIITVAKDYDGHYRLRGSLNGIEQTFFVDTGASTVAMGSAIARRAKLPSLSTVQTKTAAGIATGYYTRIDRLVIEGMEFRNVSAIVIPEMGDNYLLLGMNILSKFKLEQSEGILKLSLPLD